LTLGGYDSERITDEITWHPVLGRMYWSISLDDILINGKSMGICKNAATPIECRVTPDSGTTMMTMPSWAYTKFSNMLYYPITSSSGYPCMPGFEFE
jgi:hypothetical protein